MSTATFILIVGAVLLTVSAISEAVELLKWIDEYSGRKLK